MPIYKRCSRCGKRIEEGTRCDCNKERHKEYKRYRTDKKEQLFYSSKEWEDVRDKIREKFFGLDVYSYYVLERVEYGQSVHHIEELKENWERRLDISNLIYLTESNHKSIHRTMNKGAKDKEEIVKKLYECIKKFEEEFGMKAMI